MKFNQKKNTKNAFTMIEVLGAIFVITMGAAGVFSLIRQTISYTHTLANRLVAFYLAQEGMEIVRNIRDSNLLKIHRGLLGTDQWLSDLSSGSFYNFDYRSKSIPDSENCSGKDYLKFNGTFYECTSDSSASFQRKITLNPTSEKLEVLIEVSWQEKGKRYKVESKEILYRWYE